MADGSGFYRTFTAHKAIAWGLSSKSSEDDRTY